MNELNELHHGNSLIIFAGKKPKSFIFSFTHSRSKGLTIYLLHPALWIVFIHAFLTDTMTETGI